MGKRVRVTVEADSSFVRMLAANVELSALRDKGQERQLSPREVLALVLCAEMRGGLEQEVDALIPNEWADSFAVIHSERRVTGAAAPPPEGEEQTNG